MRVATLFKRVLRLGRERVESVDLDERDGVEKVVVGVALRLRRPLRCSGCGRRVGSAYDTRLMSWRHSRCRPGAVCDPLPGQTRGVLRLRGPR